MKFSKQNVHQRAAAPVPLGDEAHRQLLLRLAEDSTEKDPIAVCDFGVIYRKHQQWQRFLPRVEPFYAMKCNSDAGILDAMVAMDLSYDCASKAEMEMALSRGVSPSKIIYAHPCKPIAHLQYAAENGVEMMTFDNEDELHKVKEHHPNAKLVLRIRTDDSYSVCRLGVKFGALPEVTYSLLKTAKTIGVNVVGVSFHVGSGCQNAIAYNVAIEAARAIFDEAAGLGIHMTLLDIGGGFSGDDSAAVSFKDMSNVINAALDRLFPEESGVRVIAEPGRYFVHSAITLLTNIVAKRVVPREGIDTKELADRGILLRDLAADQKDIMYYVNDGLYGSFNCILYDHASPAGEPLEPREGAELVTSSIWGPTCDGLDCITKQCLMPDLAVGDWLVFPSMGAYTVAAGSTFNGFVRPTMHYVFSASEWFDFETLPEAFPITARSAMPMASALLMQEA